MKKTYSILNDNWDTVYSTTDFNKEVLTTQFEGAIRLAKEGECIQYGYEDHKYAFGASLVVEIRNGKPMLHITKGSKTFYKPYTFKTN